MDTKPTIGGGVEKFSAGKVGQGGSYGNPLTAEIQTTKWGGPAGAQKCTSTVLNRPGTGSRGVPGSAGGSGSGVPEDFFQIFSPGGPKN